jgi:hypothetical protein
MSNLVSVVHVIDFLENLMSTVILIGIRNRLLGKIFQIIEQRPALRVGIFT